MRYIHYCATGRQRTYQENYSQLHIIAMQALHRTYTQNISLQPEINVTQAEREKKKTSEYPDKYSIKDDRPWHGALHQKRTGKILWT